MKKSILIIAMITLSSVGFSQTISNVNNTDEKKTDEKKIASKSADPIKKVSDKKSVKKAKNEKQKDKQVWSDMKVIKAWKWTKRDSVALSIYSAELVIENFEKI